MPLLATACRTKYVPIESVRTEYKTLHTSDTIRLTDSVKLTQRADTIFIEKTRYRDRISTRVDTLLRVDSIPFVKEVHIEAKIPFQKRVRGFALGSLFATAILCLLFFFYRRK